MNFEKEEMNVVIEAFKEAIEYCDESLDYYKNHQFSDEYESLITEREESKKKYTTLLEKIEKGGEEVAQAN